MRQEDSGFDTVEFKTKTQKKAGNKENITKMFYNTHEDKLFSIKVAICLASTKYKGDKTE